MTLAVTHIVVTGGGTGTGAAIARKLAADGAKVTILGRTEATLATQALPYAVCDVTDPASVARAYEEARAARGPVTGVVANAGAAASKPFAAMSASDFSDALGVNLLGVFNCWHAALADMKANGTGRLIAIASTAGLKGYSYVSGYCAAKHGVVGLTRALALELARTGITVNAVCPGFIETPMLDRSVETIMAKTGMDRPAAEQSLKSINPQQRFIQPDEVADAVHYLCTEAARGINGHTLTLSGGEI